jgi:uncharacterized membrane protein YdjX (TVP38/TMEM64 family)
LRAYGPFAPAVSIALILLHAVVPLSAELLTLANGPAFGFWGGLTVSWSGFMLSALSIYAAGRLWAVPCWIALFHNATGSGSTAG